MAKKNAIEKEVDKIENQWEDFVSTGLPILRWLVTPGSNQLLSTFIQVQEHMGVTVSDFFLPLYSPFKNPESFALDLAGEINGRMEASRETVEKEANQPFTWIKPDISHCLNANAALAITGQHIIEAFGTGFENLVLVIRPSEVSSASGWRDWWQGIARFTGDKTRWPQRIKLVVFDDQKQAQLNKIAQENKTSMLSMVPPVDLKGAMNQIFSEADDGSPGAAYRKHFVALHHAVEENDLVSVERESIAALAIAGKHQWHELWVAVLLNRASAYLTNQRFDDAINDYRHAQRFAKMGEEAGKPGCDKICLQAYLSEASAWLSQQKLPEATALYQHCAVLAEKIGESFFHMDCWRMVSFCQERQKLKTEAWESALNALDAAAAVEPEIRSNSTLPYVGDALMRLAPSAEEMSRTDTLLRSYLGDEWRKLIAQPEKKTESAC